MAMGCGEVWLMLCLTDCRYSAGAGPQGRAGGRQPRYEGEVRGQGAEERGAPDRTRKVDVGVLITDWMQGVWSRDERKQCSVLTSEWRSHRQRCHRPS